MPKTFASQFKRDVVAVARRGELSINEVAAGFDISPESVRRWMRQRRSTPAASSDSNRTPLSPPAKDHKPRRSHLWP